MNAPADHASLSLSEQARRLGIADRYHGFWGEEEVVPEAVLERALAAITGQGGDPPPQHLGLPPVHVVREGESPELRWTSHDSAAARWQLAQEDNGANVATGELLRSYQQAAVALPPDLHPGYYRLTLEGAPSSVSR